MKKFLGLMAVAIVAAAAAPWASGKGIPGPDEWLKELQGVYLATSGGLPGNRDMIHQYGRYAIKGNVITKYSWDAQRKAWVARHRAKFRLVYCLDDDYMTGYNLVYTNDYGDEERMCSGDLDDDGKPDLWQSDSIYHSRQ